MLEMKELFSRIAPENQQKALETMQDCKFYLQYIEFNFQTGNFECYCFNNNTELQIKITLGSTGKICLNNQELPDYFTIQSYSSTGMVCKSGDVEYLIPSLAYVNLD